MSPESPDLIVSLVPLLVISILVSIEVCRAFGKGIGFALLMIFLPFIALPILAFGSAVYTAPAPAP